MVEEEISYRTLRKIQQLEKNSPVLTDLSAGFYTDVSEYLGKLDKRFRNEPSAQKQTLLKDEISSTKRIAVSIYEQRERKVLLAAVSKVRGGSPDLKNLLNVEEELYNSVLKIMEESRNSFLKNEIVEDNKDETENDKPAEEEKNEEISCENESNPIVRVTQTIPEFVGTDAKKYNLKKGDVLSIPEDMCNMLSKKGAVARLEK